MYNPNQTDQDDKVGDVCDNYPTINNANQDELDNNGIGDACDEGKCIYSKFQYCRKKIYPILTIPTQLSKKNAP